VDRGDKQIDVRALVTQLDVIEDTTTLCAALDWPIAPLLRARVKSTSEGSCKPAELARALGVGGERSLVARLGVVA
jgi:hypothetical protein